MALKAFIADIIDAAAIKKLRKSGAPAVVCNQLRVSLPEQLQLLDANSARTEGTWTAWRSNAAVLEGLFDKVPGLRRYDGLDLSPAFRKTVLWANRKFGYLQAYLDEHPEIAPLNPPDLYPCRRLRVLLKYLKLLRKSTRRVSGENACPPVKTRVAFMVEDLFELRVLQPVAERIKVEEVCWVIPPHHRFSEDELQEIRKGWNLWLAPGADRLLLPVFPVFMLNKKELFCLNAWMSDLKIISDALHWGDLLFGSQIRVLVTLAQENTHIGHILCGQAKKCGKHTVNTMNGIKTAEAISAEADFSTWIIWDEAMKDILVHGVSIPGKQLHVAGALQQDLLRAHRYMGTIPVSDEDLKSHRIISVVSAKDLRSDKVEALQALYQWAAVQKDVIVLYRPHPMEPEENYLLPPAGSCRYELIKPSTAESKISLMDQLMVSDLVINFGSTVSIEAKWMGIPCVTFEKKALSDLHCVDGLMLRHARSAQELTEILYSINKTVSRKQNEAVTAKERDIASSYAEIINSYATM